MRRFALATAIVLAPVVLSLGTVGAAPRKNQLVANGCSVSGNTVSAVGLPTDQVLNFMITDSAGTTGWVLGFTDNGAWTVTVPSRSERTTYEFTSRTYGANGTKYVTFARCVGD
jgi:hypothetical protein